ncbi:hypothetical protein HS125_07165 [bacterium]|nr:hypothetical protein [bacterium]
MFLSGAEPEVLDGNALLDDLFGARMAYRPDATDEDRDAYARELSRRYEAEGRPLYVIPGGGSNALGAFTDRMHRSRLAAANTDVVLIRSCTVGSGARWRDLAENMVYGFRRDPGVYIYIPAGCDKMRRQTVENMAACRAVMRPADHPRA